MPFLAQLTFDKVVRKEANKKMFYDWQKTSFFILFAIIEMESKKSAPVSLSFSFGEFFDRD